MCPIKRNLIRRVEKRRRWYEMLKKIYQELVLIRKELQAIRSSKESSSFVPEDSDGIRDFGLSKSNVPFRANLK